MSHANAEVQFILVKYSRLWIKQPISIPNFLFLEQFGRSLKLTLNVRNIVHLREDGFPELELQNRYSTSRIGGPSGGSSYTCYRHFYTTLKLFIMNDYTKCILIKS